MSDEEAADIREAGSARAGHEAAPSDCQLPTAGGGGTPLTPAGHIRVWSVRLLRAAERRIGRLASRLSRPAEFRPRSGGVSQVNSPLLGDEPLEQGDFVEVLAYEQILGTLDEHGRCDGLDFMDGMRRYCGQRRRVLKKVRQFYDEHERRMLRVKRGRYLLDGAICDGYGAYDQEGCDRACFYFWSARWLERAVPPAP